MMVHSSFSIGADGACTPTDMSFPCRFVQGIFTNVERSARIRGQGLRASGIGYHFVLCGGSLNGIKRINLLPCLLLVSLANSTTPATSKMATLSQESRRLPNGDYSEGLSTMNGFHPEPESPQGSPIDVPVVIIGGGGTQSCFDILGYLSYSCLDNLWLEPFQIPV